MTQTLERLRYRLEAVTSGQEKMEGFLKAEPNSPNAALWRKRLEEYQASAVGLPQLIKQMEAKAAKQQPAATDKPKS